MKKPTSSILALGIVALILSACATHDTKPEALQELISKQSQLQQDQRIASNAGIELNELRQYVDKANNLWQEGEQEEYQQQLYLATRQASIAESTGLANYYREQIDAMSEERQELLLQAKNAELERTENRLQTTTSELSQTQQELASNEQQVLALAEELSNAKAEMTSRGMVLTLQDILFEFNKSDLKPGATRTVAKVAEFLTNNPGVVVTIEGFTDSAGPEQYNLGLSKKRAESVEVALIQQGIDPERLSTRAMGEAFPVASNETPAGRQENRRVELVLKQAAQEGE